MSNNGNLKDMSDLETRVVNAIVSVLWLYYEQIPTTTQYAAAEAAIKVIRADKEVIE
jgi:hypothetical protein